MASDKGRGWLAILGYFGIASLVIVLSILWGPTPLKSPVISPETEQRLEKEARQRMQKDQERMDRWNEEQKQWERELAKIKEKFKEPPDDFYQRQRKILMDQTKKTP